MTVLTDKQREGLRLVQAELRYAEHGLRVIHGQMLERIEAARAAGATNREIGDVLGVSRQRVSQLLRKDSK